MKNPTFFNFINRSFQHLAPKATMPNIFTHRFHSTPTTNTIEGWACPGVYPHPFPDVFPQTFEHTYVVRGSTRWGCNGEYQGGHLISSSEDNFPQLYEIGYRYGWSKTEHCVISNYRTDHDTFGRRYGFTRDHDTVGIRYGFDGVCHQIANRLLGAQANAHIFPAMGAKLTSAYYGPFGGGAFFNPRLVGSCRMFSRDLLPSRFISFPNIDIREMQERTESLFSPRSYTVMDSSTLDDEQKLIVQLKYISTLSFLSVIEEKGLCFELMLRHFFGSKISDNQIGEAVKTQSTLLEKNSSYLCLLFLSEELSTFNPSRRVSYEKMRDNIQTAYESFARILGESAYGDYFDGIEPMHAPFAINPIIFPTLEITSREYNSYRKKAFFQ